MATAYLRSTDGNDADNGSTWALADATLVSSLVAAGAGGTSYMSQVHAESTVGDGSILTLAAPGTAGTPNRVICGNDAAEPPTAVATTGSVSTTGDVIIFFTGFCNVFGVSFVSGNSTGDAHIQWTSGSAWGWLYEDCTFRIRSTGASARYRFGTPFGSTNQAGLDFIDCTFAFSSTSQGVLPGCAARLRGGSIAATGSVPTTLFLTNSGYEAANIRIEGVDLSAFASGTNLVSVAGALNDQFSFINCKLGASVSITTGSFTGPNGVHVMLVNCDSADTQTRFYFAHYQGTTTHETTIVRTGGANDGTTAFSRKMASSANTNFSLPHEGPWFKSWNETVGSPVTVAIEIITDSVTLTNAEAWVECQYQGTLGFPLALTATDRAADILATPANQTTSSETWTTTGLTTPVKQVLSVQVTPAEIGWIYARVNLAKASTTLYACPKILSSSELQYMEMDGSIVNLPAGGSGGITAPTASFGQSGVLIA